jgi:hypothetical protein
MRQSWHTRREINYSLASLTQMCQVSPQCRHSLLPAAKAAPAGIALNEISDIAADNLVKPYRSICKPIAQESRHASLIATHRGPRQSSCLQHMLAKIIFGALPLSELP